MPKSVRYETKIVGITAVELEGILEQSLDDGCHWHCGKDDLEEWLDKFEGKRIRIMIESPGQDDSHLLPDDERE